MISETDFSHLFCLLIGISRGLDLLSTWLITPTLSLEANPIMKKLRWRTIVLVNLPLLILPYIHLGLSLTMIILSFLVAGNTLSNAALSRGLGENHHLRSIKKAIKGNSLAKSLILNSLGAFSIIGAGSLLMAITDNPWKDLEWWGALGIVSYGLTGLIQVNFSMIKLFQKTDYPKEKSISEVGTAGRSEERAHEIRLQLTVEQYEQIYAKAQLFGKGVESFCRMVIIESKAKIK